MNVKERKPSLTLESIHRRIVRCEACPRLRAHCLEMARIKRKSYREETYWGKPITGFGDPEARLVVVGLAPAAHGANRTGRIFTGDRSGEWLYRALFEAGFANQPESRSRTDGLELHDAYITCVVKCAPPDNKPLPDEQARCGRLHLQPELAALARARVWLALGQIALNGLWPHLVERHAGHPLRKPKFAHGGTLELPEGELLLLSYHPSQQNTFTGRLTRPMFASVFAKARHHLSAKRY